MSFLCHDGKPTETKSHPQSSDISFARFRDGYLKTVGNGSVERNTLYTAKIHLTHLADTRGDRFSLVRITQVTGR